MLTANQSKSRMATVRADRLIAECQLTEFPVVYQSNSGITAAKHQVA